MRLLTGSSDHRWAMEQPALSAHGGCLVVVQSVGQHASEADRPRHRRRVCASTACLGGQGESPPWSAYGLRGEACLLVGAGGQHKGREGIGVDEWQMDPSRPVGDRCGRECAAAHRASARLHHVPAGLPHRAVRVATDRRWECPRGARATRRGCMCTMRAERSVAALGRGARRLCAGRGPVRGG